ncbi:MAG: tail fiber domain-containing protein, partial [Candidatus Omnitrophota bacterium]
RIAIGDDYIDGANYTWQDTESGSGEVDFAADLVVEGNVGIGTANPSVTLDIGGAWSGGTVGRELRISNSSDYSILRLGQDSTHNGYLAWYYNTAAASAYLNLATYGGINPLVLQDAGGNVGIGTTSPWAPFHVYNSASGRLAYFTGTSSASSVIEIGYGGGTAQAAEVGFIPSSGFGYLTVLGSPTLLGITSSGNVGIGTTAPGTLLQIGGGTGSLHVITPGLLIKNTTAYERSMMEIHAPSGANRLVIQTLADTSYIASLDAKPLAFQTSGGNVGIGTGAPGAVLEVDGTGVLQTLYHSGGSTSGVYTYYSVAGGGAIGSVTYNGSWSGILFNTSSDRRLKENIVSTSRGLKELMSIPVDDFNFISDPGKKKVQGFIAQKLYKVYPEAVTVGGKDPKTEPWMVDYARLTPLLVKSVQELKGENDSIKSELCRKDPGYSWCRR